MKISSRSGLRPVNDTRLYYETAGNGSTAVVLIHGMTLDTRMWSDQFAPLAEKHTVVRYDMRGFGRSKIPVEGQPYSHVDYLRALLEYLHISSAALVGLSFGGGVALDFALTYPHMTGSLVLADSVLGGWDWSPEWSDQAGRVWATGRREGANAARRLWMRMPVFAPAFDQPSVGARLKQMMSDYSGWHWTHDDPEICLDPPTAQRLKEISLPVQIILGERDVSDFQTIAATLTAGISGAAKFVIPEVGHMSNMEAPTAFNRAVLEFLG